MKKCFKSLREHAMEISNFEKKKMIPSTNEQYDLYLYQIKCHIWKQKFEHKYTSDENYDKVKDHCKY